LAKRVTVIDIGSNSIRMVVYEKTSRFSFHILHEEKSRVRLSENSYQNDGYLQEIPMQRTFDALKDFISIHNSFKSRKMLCVATSALRDAPNKKEFIAKVKERLKLNIKIIDGQKEAYLSAMACANLLPKQQNALSIDIGGGSTEFAIVDDKNISETISLDLGTVRLKELFLDDKDINGARKYIDKELQKLNISDKNILSLIGIGGTFRAISTAIMKIDKYPFEKLHTYEYSKNRLEDFVVQLLNTVDDEQLKLLEIATNRFDVIRSGVLILERVLKLIDIKNIITSGVGVREGVYLADLLRNSKHSLPHNYNSSVRYLIDKYIEDKNYSNQLNSLAKKLFDLTADYFCLDKKYRFELAIAAKLYPIGTNVHYYSKNKHSYYLIQTALEYGFRHNEIILISLLNRYATHKFPSSSDKKRYAKLLPDSQSLDSLSYILSLSIALLTHKPRNIDFDLDFNDGILSISSDESLFLSRNAIDKLGEYKDFRIQF